MLNSAQLDLLAKETGKLTEGVLHMTEHDKKDIDSLCFCIIAEELEWKLDGDKRYSPYRLLMAEGIVESVG